MELTFSLSGESGVPYYEQLYRFIRNEIQCGHIQSGVRLPSIRGLSQTIGISTTTTEEAYQQLVAEGYIVSKPKAGFFVLSPEDTMETKIGTVIETPSQGASTEDGGHIEIDFHPARVDKGHFPQTAFRKVLNSVWKDMDSELLDYGDSFGEWGLRSALADYLRHARGVVCHPGQIVIGSGVQYSIQLVMDLLRGDLTGVATENPGYDRVLSVVRRSGLPMQSVSVDSEGIIIEELNNASANLVCVTPSHQFPHGMVMSYSRRLQLLQWAGERRVWIIEDDYDGEFRYGERPIPSLQGLDGTGSVIYIGTLSKALSPSFRLNYMVLPQSLVDKHHGEIQQWDCPVPRYHQVALQKFIEFGYWDKHIRRVRRIYRAKHAVLMEAIRSEFGDHAEITGQGAGLHMALQLHSDMTREQLRDSAESVGVRVYFPSIQHSSIPRGNPMVLLGFGGLTTSQIQEGVRRLRRCWL